MQSFISETIDTILKTTKSFNNVVFVLPSQRAGVFIKQNLKNKISTGFLPEILNIEQLVESISGIKKIDPIQLLFHFYSIYKEQEQNPVTFDIFSSWAFTIIQDFNEIDQHLVNSREIFIYLRDIERLKKWSVKGTFRETELIKDHFSFIEKLNLFYDTFYKFLVDNKIGYQGVLYREAVRNCANFLEKNNHKQYYFIGFNALNTAEEKLFQQFLLNGNAKAFWDIDKSFLESNHQAGNFIRKYITKWNYYHQKPLDNIKANFEKNKHIEIIGTTKNISQIKYAGEILSNLKHHNNTALVMADETLLPITLNSLPENVKEINITMGYPLKDIPTTSLIFSIFQLFISQEKLNKTEANLFYYKDVVQFLKQANIYNLFVEDQIDLDLQISQKIISQNKTFVDSVTINNIFKELKENTNLKAIFNPFTTISDFLERIIHLINQLKENTSEIEKEYLFRYYTAFMQLQNLDFKYKYINDLKTLYQFFKQIIQSETLSFQGEPLQGLQLMGMLETRVLDFENLILTSVNEGVLPANKQQNSFIPFDVKVQFGLPTYREKDAIFSYHFFRLLQRAKNVFILYNTESDSFGGGEKSRFVTQLEMIKDNIIQKTIAAKVTTSTKKILEIEKNDTILNRLKEIAEKGISPSTLTNYLYNPIAFYKQKILRIKDLESIEETIAANTLGTVIHETLDELYTPFKGKYLLLKDVENMFSKVEELITKYFKKHFTNGDITTGKNRLIFEVAKRFVQNFLNKEKELLKDPNNQLKIIETEVKLNTIIEVENIPYPIKIHGEVDRIDELNGTIRIIDYKSGKVEANDLKVSDISKIIDFKYNKAIQVMLYAFLFVNSKHYNNNKDLEAGVISFKNLKNGFLKMNFAEKRNTQENTITLEKIEEFLAEIKILLQEIYNKEINFIEAQDLPF